MNNIPKSFLSPLLAQKKLKSTDGSSGNSSNSCAIIATNTCKEDMNNNPNISTIPTFHHIKEVEECTDYGIPLSEVVAMFARKAKSVYERAVLSVRGQEILAKANEYEISYDLQDIDFLSLMDQVEEFEETIAEAARYGIDWQNFGYDLLGIEQEISESVEAENDYSNYTRNEFYANCGVA